MGSDMRVAIIHYWLVGMRGGERVLEALCELFPNADIYTHVYDPAQISETINSHKVRTTFIQRLPMATRLYRRYLPLMPIALEQIDLRGYQLVLSNESGPVKGVIRDPGALHICYCLTVPRYLWDMYHNYLEESGPVTRMLMRLIIHYLRIWDYASAARVDHFIADSRFAADRIAAYYRRTAEVIYPPVDVESFRSTAAREDFYLMVGELVRYKRFDLAVQAFNAMGKPLVIIGKGPELKSLRRQAGPNVTLLGNQPASVLREHYARARALIFPGIEDFGLVPVEAMASGCPVIAYRGGGALETVVEGRTGIFFEEQSCDSLIEAIGRFERDEHRFSTQAMVEHARNFGREKFKRLMSQAIERELAARKRPEARSSEMQKDRIAMNGNRFCGLTR